MIWIVPTVATPSQSLSITLAQQRVRLEIHQKAFGLYVDVYSNDVLVIGGVVARNLTYIVRSAYLGFTGDLFFHDTQGADDPNYTGLGTRFLLFYEN